MKLRNHQFSTQPPIFDGGYEHPWYKHQKKDKLIRPNPPTKEAVRRAKFRDKTYQWSRSNDLRSGNKRTFK